MCCFLFFLSLKNCFTIIFVSFSVSNSQNAHWMGMRWGKTLMIVSCDRILWSTIEYIMSHGYSHTSYILQFGFWQCAERSFTIVTTIRHYIVMIARFTICVIFRLMKWKGSSNKHFSLPSLFSTGWFQEQIRWGFQTWTKINTGALWQIDIYVRQVPSSDIVQQTNKQTHTY